MGSLPSWLGRRVVGLMSNEKVSLPSEEEFEIAYRDGYNCGFNMDSRCNPYCEDNEPELWAEYECGYLMGYSES